MMRLIDLELRTETPAEMMQALRDAGLMKSGVDDDDSAYERIAGEPLTSVCDIGELRRVVGTTTDAEGNEVPEYELIPGYHVNVTTRDSAVADALAPLDVAPDTPLVRWAGR